MYIFYDEVIIYTKKKHALKRIKYVSFIMNNTKYRSNNYLGCPFKHTAHGFSFNKTDKHTYSIKSCRKC